MRTQPARVVGNMHKNLLKFGRVVFELCQRSDKHTDRHKTDITILRNLTGVK